MRLFHVWSPLVNGHVATQDVFWSDAGDQLAVVSATNTFFMLKYNAEAVANFAASGEEPDEDGIEDAFEVRGN